MAHPLRHQWHNPEPEQFRFACDEVEFAGFQITLTEVKPSAKYLQSISQFPMPQGITDIRAWFGLVKQVAYAFSMTSVMSPFRALLKPSAPFTWNTELGSIRCLEEDLLEDSGGSENFREVPPHLPGNRLEQRRDRVLAVPKTLPVPIPRNILLPGRLEGHLGGLPFHPPGRITLCPGGRRGTGSGRRAGQGTPLCARPCHSR